MTRDDASAALEPWAEDEEAMEMLSAKRRRWRIADQVAYFSTFQDKRNRLLLGLFPRDQREPVGMFIINLRQDDAVMLVTHLLGNKEWRGTGASREASIGIFDYFFNELGFAKAKANVLLQNKAMQWLLLNGGWQREAHLLKHLRRKTDGGRSDVYVFGILADEWRARRNSANTVPRRKPGMPARQP